MADVSIALDEAEPNDSFATGNDATKTTFIRGAIEDTVENHFDFFKIHTFNTFDFDLEAEARIVSGPDAGSEKFSLSLTGQRVPPYTNIQFSENGFPSGNGSVVLRNREKTPRFAPLFLAISFSPQIAPGTYEITYSLKPRSRPDQVPLIYNVETQIIGREKVSVSFSTNTTGNTAMRLVSAKASGNRRAFIVSNYFGTRYVNTPSGPDYSSASGYDFTYLFKLKRPVTRLEITAEDSAGLKSKVIQIFRKSKPRSGVRSRVVPVVAMGAVSGNNS